MDCFLGNSVNFGVHHDHHDDFVKKFTNELAWDLGTD